MMEPSLLCILMPDFLPDCDRISAMYGYERKHSNALRSAECEDLYGQ